MAFKPPKASNQTLRQVIDLKDVFGADLSSSDLDKLKEEIGQKLLDRIKDRTESGIAIFFDENGNARYGKLKSPYSKTYRNSPEFRAFRKSENKINMTLTGDMLGLMDVKVEGSKLILGWDDDVENAKAFNHQIGETVPRRPFFGISKGDLLSIKREYNAEIKTLIKDRDADEG